MKIKGTATIRTYSLGGMLLNETVQDNIVTRSLIDRYIISQLGLNDGFNIALSEKNTAPNYNETTLNQIISIGTSSGVANPNEFVRRTLTEPASKIYRRRFAPPTGTRTFSSIGIVSGNPVNETSGQTSTNYTYLLLDNPITQQNFEIIDIDYKITFNWSANSNIGVNAQEQIERTLCEREAPPFDTSGLRVITDFAASSTSTSQLPGDARQYIYGGVEQSSFYSNSSLPLKNPFTVSRLEIANRAEARATYASSTFNQYTGAIIRQIDFGDSGIFPDSNGIISFDDTFAPLSLDSKTGSVKLNKTGTLSSVFSHNETTQASLFDINSLANSSWKPLITDLGGSDFPSQYHLKVSQSGGVGVGEYKLYKSGFSGFTNSSSYRGRYEYIWDQPALSDAIDEFSTTTIFNYRWVYNWSAATADFKFVSYKRYAGVALLQLTDEDLVEVNKYTLNSFPQLGTYIYDVEVNPGANLIYVASDSGLHSINITNNVITTLNADQCISVVKGISKVWAVFADLAGTGRLSSSDNYSTAVSLGAAIINWDNVWRLFIDPDSANHELMIYEGNCSKNDIIRMTDLETDIYKIHWYSEAAGFVQTDLFDYDQVTTSSVVNPSALSYELFVLPTNKSVVVTNGVWIYPGSRADCLPPGLETDTVFDYKPVYSRHLMFGITPPDTRRNLSKFRFNVSTNNSTANNSEQFNRNSVSAENIDFRSTYIAGASGEYLFGKFATAPFYTSFQNHNLCEVFKGKPNPTDTTYSLYLMFGMGYDNIDHDPNFTRTSSRMNCLVRFDVDEAGTSTEENYAKEISTIYSPAQNSEYSSNRKMYCANFCKISDDHVIFLVAPSLGWRRSFGSPGGRALIEPNDDSSNITNTFSGIQIAMTGGIGFMQMMFDPTRDFNDRWLSAYSWNGTAWVPDPLNTGPGRPLHTTTEDLIDNLEIQWTDLNPTNSGDLIVDQHYNFIRLTDSNSIMIEEGFDTGSLDISWSVYLRDAPLASVGGTVSTGTPNFIIPEASDSFFWGLVPQNSQDYSATINGVDAPVLVNNSTNPPAGTIHVTDALAGEIYFNGADAGQPFTFNYRYLKKIEESETPAL